MFPEEVKKLIAIGAGEWRRACRTFNLDSASLAQIDSHYLQQQLALMPEPQRLDRWLYIVNQYYNAVSVGKEIFNVIHCPVLIMAGERDENAPLETVIAAYKMIPNAQLSIIPNAPHPAFLVNFPALWTSITPFLN
ncbi:alpha/beta fold hydrolase [Pedobacter immunditicola]|uniref:alpha/beta fold hydrolase n=1 Tax=Pedobacter immunditicola TaxID=3133440 RepID=UPI0030B4C931